MHCMILISMLKLMMTFTCDQVSDNIPISPFNNCLIGILPFEMLMLALVISLCADRLSLLLAKERSHPQTYIGCMKKGPVFTDPKLKWLVLLFNVIMSSSFQSVFIGKLN